MKITEAEILQAIRDAASKVPERPANLIRAVELQERLGWGHVQTREVLRRWIAEGIAEPCKWPIKDLSGRIRKTEHYRLLRLPE